MGYRELLKRYIRFLELKLGDNYIEAIDSAPEPMLSARDIGELRTLAGEIFREAHTAEQAMRIENYNYRMRLLFNRYSLSVSQAAMLAGVSEDTVRRWRTSPRSARYERMTERQFSRFERALQAWVEGDSPPKAKTR
jgi:hypothetical protein